MANDYIQPTIGRIVHFREAMSETVVPAIVTGIVSVGEGTEDRIEIQSFGSSGRVHDNVKRGDLFEPLPKVEHFPEGKPGEEGTEGASTPQTHEATWDWMPYQKSNASTPPSSPPTDGK